MNKTLYLMHRDIPVAEMRTLQMSSGNKIPIGFQQILVKNELPVGTYSEESLIANMLFDRWLKSRMIPESRPGIQKILQKYGKTKAELFMASAGVCITDGYYFSDDPENVKWEDVNYHDNGFDEFLLKEKLQEREEKFAKEKELPKTPDFTTDGVMEKFWCVSQGLPCLIKADVKKPVLCANEIVYSKISPAALAVEYNGGLLHDKIPYCICPSFVKSPEEDFVTGLQVKHQNMQMRRTDIFRSFVEMGFKESIQKMITLDCIFHNTDRHENNFGYIRNCKNGEIRMAPFFDNGRCLGSDNSDKNSIRDRDMKLFSGARKEILEQFGCKIEIDRPYALQMLQETYEDFDISEEIFVQAKNELEYGLRLYVETVAKNQK